MDDFTLPPRQPLPPNTDGQASASLPPRHKSKVAQPPQSPNAEERPAEEDVPPLIEPIPQCDWHLGSLFSGNYPDPFTLPILHFAKKSLVVDMAALITAMIKAGAKITGVRNTTNTESAYNKPLNDSSPKT